MTERSLSTSTTYNTTYARLDLHSRSGQRSDSDVNIVCSVGNECTISHTYQTTVANLLVLVGNLLRSESCVVDINLTRSRAVIHRAVEHASDSTRVNTVGDGHINICQLHVLDSCRSDVEQRSVQALDSEVATIEGVLAKVLDRLPIVACHIDLGSNLSRSAWVETTCDTSKLDKSLLAVDDELLAILVCQVSLVVYVAELANSAWVDRASVAVELNGHLAVILGEDGNHKCTILTCRNCNEEWSSLSTEYQALATSYGYHLRCAIQSGQCTSCAIYGVRTCDSTLLRLNADACHLLAVTLDSQVQYTCEVVELNRSLLLTLSCSSCVAVHRSRLRSERAYGVRLSCSESYRIDSCRSLYNLVLNSRSCWCRVNHTEWALNNLCEAECLLCCVLRNTCQRKRICAIDSNSVALAPIEWIEALHLLAELSTRLLQRDRNLINATLVALDLDAEVVSCVLNARECEQTGRNCQEKFCQIFHCVLVF